MANAPANMFIENMEAGVLVAFDCLSPVDGFVLLSVFSMLLCRGLNR